MVPPTVRTKFSSKLIPVRGHERLVPHGHAPRLAGGLNRLVPVARIARRVESSRLLIVGGASMRARSTVTRPPAAISGQPACTEHTAAMTLRPPSTASSEVELGVSDHAPSAHPTHRHLPLSPRILLYLPVSPRSPHISLYLPVISSVSPDISPHLVSPGISPYLVSPSISQYFPVSRGIPRHPAISRGGYRESKSSTPGNT